MKRRFFWSLAVLSILLGNSTVRAQEIVGQWQGILHAGKDLRIVMKVFPGENGALKADFYSIDQTPNPYHSSTFTRDGASIQFAINTIGGSYDGKLSADGKIISGTWTQLGNPISMDLARATRETAWDIPAPSAPPKLMAANADPAFEVATIKPNNSGAPRLQGLRVRGRQFLVSNGSLADLIDFAFNVQEKQIVGGPDWIYKDRYDIEGEPDTEGAPNDRQLRSMIRKLLTERFAMKFHNEKKEMPAFVLTVAKGGPKLPPAEGTGSLPTLALHPAPGGIGVLAHTATLEDFCIFLQGLVLDRPVVDQTELSGKYDIDVTFTADDSQFGGHPPQFPKSPESVEPAPSLSEAVQQTLGLKLSPEKTEVGVLVLDHVEKPSAN